MQDKNDKQKLYLKCLFTEEEKIALASEMAQQAVTKDSLQQHLKETTAHFKAQIESCETIIKKNATLIKDGYEFRYVPCSVDYNVPERGMKTCTRVDTGESFVEPMNNEEKANLFYNVDAPAAEEEAEKEEVAAEEEAEKEGQDA